MRYLSILLLAVISLFIVTNCDTNSVTKYKVSISAVPNDGGTVSPSSGNYETGTTLHLSATPADSSWQFDKWSGDYQGTSSSATITINDPKNIIAHFSKKKFNLTIHTQGQGTVEQKVIPTSSVRGYNYGTVIRLTAKPDSGWKFVKWKGDISFSPLDNPTRIFINKPKTVTAVFQKKLFFLGKTE